MKKKVVASLLVATMVFGLTACGGSSDNSNGGSDNKDIDTSKVAETNEKEIDGITYHLATDLTTDEIELTYMTWDDEQTVNRLKDRFEELYPNIHVTVAVGSEAGYQETLLTMVQNGDTPDVMMYTDCEFVLSNQLLYDITDIYNADPETKEMASTINDAGIGEFGTGRRFVVPATFNPGIMFVDRNVLTALNKPMPDNSWTWSEMIQLIKDCTVDPGDGSMKYYGLGFYNRLDSYYGIASSQDIVGEFGFNGKTFDLSAWAIGEQEFASLKQDGYVAPSANTPEMEEWYGDFLGWCGSTGRVAIFSEGFWTFQNIWNTEAYKEFNLDICPLVIPAVSEEDAGNDHHTIANIQFAGVGEDTEHPREAYELLKFMTFGRNGWLTRIQLYNNGETTADGTTLLRHSGMPAPITTNEEVWEAYIDMYCDGMDEEHTQMWRDYFQSCLQPIPFGWVNIAGYWNYCDGYFNRIGIHTLVDNGTAKAADFVKEATEQANAYHAQAMIDYFGEDGYDILSDEDLAFYQGILDETPIDSGTESAE